MRLGFTPLITEKQRPSAGPGHLKHMAIFILFFVGMVGCEATMSLPDNHGSLSINTLRISQISLSLRGGTNNQEREAKSTLGLLNVQLNFAPIFLICSVHTEGDESSLEAKIGLIEQEIDVAARETTSALD